MSNTLARMGNAGGAVTADRALPWTPFNDLLGFDPFQSLRASYGFDYDVSRTESGYEVEVPVPGYGPAQIEVNHKDGLLTVAGKSEKRSFTRSFTIPDDVDTDAISARVADGMLHLTLQRRPEARPKRIPVN